MPVLSDLEPREVFAWFERLCAIPHGSHHAKAISDYLVAFARERGLACRQDAANNVVIRKAASAGYENAPVVMQYFIQRFGLHFSRHGWMVLGSIERQTRHS